MSDIFAPLREAEPVSAPAPEEVRRRGDRMRRRRAGLAVVGAVCAAAMVVGGTSLVLGDRTSSDSAPEPVDSPTDTVIPAEFDLAEGLPRRFTNPDVGAPELKICGEAFPFVDHAIASQGVRRDERGDFQIRGLVVYPDTGTARVVATDLIATVKGCPRFTDGRGRTWTTSVRPTNHGDQGWVVARRGTAPGPRVDFPEVIQIVRLGASLLVLHQREVHGVALKDRIRSADDQVEWLLHRQMCLLTEEGCAWRSEPDVLRPDGWGPWRLGMSREDVEAIATGSSDDAGECDTVDLESGTLWVSESDGLVRIQVPEGVTTPDGIGVGSSREEVFERYWFARVEGDVVPVRASPTTDYEITFQRDRVTQLALSTFEHECFA